MLILKIAIVVAIIILLILLCAEPAQPVINEPADPPKEDDPPIDPPVDDPADPVDPPIDPPKEVDPSKFWYKIYLMAQSRPPDAWMKNSLSEEEYEYYSKHKSEFSLGAPVLYDSKGNKL